MAPNNKFSQIAVAQVDSLSRSLLTAMERFYSVPENLARFNRWLLSEDGKRFSEQAASTQTQ